MGDSKGKKGLLPSNNDVTPIANFGSSSTSKADTQYEQYVNDVSSLDLGGTSPGTSPVDNHTRLHRGLSTRQVQMIAIAGKETLSTLPIIYSDGLILY